MNASESELEAIYTSKVFNLKLCNFTQGTDGTKFLKIDCEFLKFQDGDNNVSFNGVEK